MQTIPKQANGQDKIVNYFTLAFDDDLHEYVIYSGKDDKLYPLYAGSEKNGTKVVKTYKTIDNAKRAFAKAHDANNADKFVRFYNVLIVKGNS